jgi:uncharacterized membrane protein
MVDLNIFVIFAFGSFTGWLIELIWRSYVLKKRSINFGYLSGPYLPIWGFSVICLYFISFFNINIFFKIILFLLSILFIEYIVGYLLLKYYNIRLWNYSKQKFNYNGIISLYHSILWLIFSIIFYIFIYPVLDKLIYLFETVILLQFILLIFYVVLFIDFLYNIFKNNK